MKKTKKGFTLVELVIVVAVMAVLVAVAIPTVSAITNTAKENVAKTNAKTIESMLKLYQAENSNTSSASGTTFDWGQANVEKAIDDAHLGITDTVTYFTFDASKGTVRVKVDGDTAGGNIYIINFGTDGDASVAGDA